MSGEKLGEQPKAKSEEEPKGQPEEPKGLPEEPRDFKKIQAELSNAETKLRKLFEKRNEWNNKGKVLRTERDSLNEKRRSVIGKVRELRETRHGEIEELKRRCEEIVGPYRRERDRFNTMVQLQKKKKEGRRSRDAEDHGERKPRRRDPVTEMNMLTIERQMILEKYETNAMGRKAEKETMEKVRRLELRIKELEKEVPSYQKEEMKEVRKSSPAGSTDYSAVAENIGQLSQKAQHFHDLFSRERKKFNEKMSSVYEKYQKLIDEMEGEISSLATGADRKHREYMETREKADHFHKRAMEYRQGVVIVRKERDVIMNEISRTMDEHNASVEDSLENEDMKKEAENKALEMLLKGKKISF